MRRLSPVAALVASMSVLSGAADAAGKDRATPADTVYRNGHLYTADASDRVVEALAIRGGRIAYVGADQGVTALIGPKTRVVDLAGRFAMPGLVDAHMHPLEGGSKLRKCNLNYARLTVPEFQARIQACLDASRDQEPNGWLQVVSWFQQAMLPAGVAITHATLDGLNTKRPIMVRDSFGHTALANARALALGGITSATPDPAGGHIGHDAGGALNGLLEDSAGEPLDALIPPQTPAENRAAARTALEAMARQGITSALDADATGAGLEAFTAAAHDGALTARMHFAMHIDTTDIANPAAAVARVVEFRRRFNQVATGVAPVITVRNAKLYIDGVISGPAFTGTMLAPYRVNTGTAEAPHWQDGPTRGPEPYYPAPVLADFLVRLARAGIDPHMHVDGDRAVRVALDGIEAMRRAVPGGDIRPSLAHDEIVDRADYPRYKALGVHPVLSFQWEKPAPDTVEQARDFLGPERAAILEPAGLLAAAGAPVAFGSDWPVDALDEWFALKVAVTRENDPASGYRGRLGEDPGLTAVAALRAATITAAHALHDDARIGSLEQGKLADLIVLDRNPLTIPPAEIAGVRVLETVVGGRVVWRAP